jgi:predicted small integral membrane protein
MLRIWIVFLLASFVVSLLTLTRIQVRFARKLGWSAFQRSSLIKIYWTDISPLERVLVWTGISAFLLSLLAARVWKVITAGPT